MVTVIKPLIQIVYFTYKHQYIDVGDNYKAKWALSNWDMVASSAKKIDREEVYQVYCKTGRDGFFSLEKAIAGLALVREEATKDEKTRDLNFKVVKITWTPNQEEDIIEN